MNTRPSITIVPIRMVFELDRADNPRLYDDLIRFTKGTKRVNRLRTLAQEGLLAQNWVVGQGGSALQATVEPTFRGASDASITSQVFDEPLTD